MKDFRPQLLIPASFNECLTYELQIAWLKKEIDDIATGGSSSTVEELERRVNQLESELSSLQEEVDGFNITHINEQITDLYGDVEELQTASARYALKSEIPDVSDFVTETELNNTLSDYATKSEIPDVSGLETQAHANATFATKSEIPDVSDFVTETELNNTLSDYATKSEIPDVSGLETQAHANATFATKSEIPDISGLETQVHATATFATKTQLQQYALKSEIPEGVIFDNAVTENSQNGVKSSGIYTAIHDAVNGLETQTHANATFARKDELPDMNDYETVAHAEDTYATKAEISDMATQTDLEDYALKSEIPESIIIDNNVTENSSHAVKSSGIYTFVEEEISGLATTEQLATKQDVLDFDNVPTENSDNPVKSGGVYSAIDDAIAGLETQAHANTTFATKSEIAGFMTETAADNKYETQAHASATYATKSEIPDVSALETQAHANATFATKSEISETYATKAALQTKQNTLTFDLAPQLGSSNPVTSSGIYQAIQAVSGGGGGGGATSLAELSDVSLFPAPFDGAILKYNSASGKWVLSGDIIHPEVTGLVVAIDNNGTTKAYAPTMTSSQMGLYAPVLARSYDAFDTSDADNNEISLSNSTKFKTVNTSDVNNYGFGCMCISGMLTPLSGSILINHEVSNNERVQYSIPLKLNDDMSLSPVMGSLVYQLDAEHNVNDRVHISIDFIGNPLLGHI